MPERSITIGLQSRRSGWTADEEALLRREIEQAAEKGEPLRAVFERVAGQTHRKPNSIRNYYYTTLHQSEGQAAFVPFTEDEARQLLYTVLRAQAEGVSVRKCTMAMGGGDRSAMLRYQNKYRSLLRTHPEAVQAVIRQMQAEGIPCKDPYEKGAHTPPQKAGRWDRLTEDTTPAVQAALEAIESLAAAGSRLAARRQAEQYDALAARYDALAIAYEQLHGQLALAQAEEDALRRLCYPAAANAGEATRQEAACRLEALCRTFSAEPPEGRRAQADEFARQVRTVLAALDGCLQTPGGAACALPVQ